jgi:multimeric flavodoxin WrbA
VQTSVKEVFQTMRITVINDQTNCSELGQTIRKGLDTLLGQLNCERLFYDIRKDDLHHCIGCFNCWVKTPGICVFADIGRDICHTCSQSDVSVYVSPINYGCYSPTIRRVMDRQLPSVLPFFQKINNELHHTPRYERYPQLVMIGYSENITAAEAETFKSLTDANAHNFQIAEAQTYLCRSSEMIAPILGSLTTFLKGVPERC